MKPLAFLTLSLLLAATAAAELTVASFHPLVTDLAKQVGGGRVTALAVVTTKDNPHTYQPTASDLNKTRTADLILVSGKGLEPYLDVLQDNLSPNQRIVQVGRKIPSILITAGDLFVCCPAHSKGAIDPHWWHSPDNMGRAAAILGKEFAAADPAGAATYKANAKAAAARFDKLEKWAKSQFAKIPRSSRLLATSHAAYGYFCKSFGFRSIPVRGLAAESEPSSKYLAETIGVLTKHRVPAVFPEVSANPKILQELTRTTGAKLAAPLIADGTGSAKATTFESMFRHNVTTIVAGLAQ